MSIMLYGLKFWLSCETLTVSNVFNSMSIRGGSLLNATGGEKFEKMQFDPRSYK